MYKDELREQILQALNEYFKMEQGNRLTVFSMNGLSMHIDKLFELNQIDDDVKKDE